MDILDRQRGDVDGGRLPRHREDHRERAAAEGADIEFVEGNAQELPYEEANEATDGAYHAEPDYLLTVARRPRG